MGVNRGKYGNGAVVEDLGSGYTGVERGVRRRAYRVALRVGEAASVTDFHEVKRAAVKQLGRLVARAGERYDDGNLTEREYVVDGRWVWELCWSHKAGGGGVADGGGPAALSGGDAARGGADVGGDRG